MYIDITCELNEKMAIYPANPPFSINKIKNGASVISELCMGSHTGTHIDAPSHFIENGNNINEIALERMNGTAKVIYLPNSSEITVNDLKELDIKKMICCYLKQAIQSSMQAI